MWVLIYLAKICWLLRNLVLNAAQAEPQKIIFSNYIFKESGKIILETNLEIVTKNKIS